MSLHCHTQCQPATIIVRYIHACIWTYKHMYLYTNSAHIYFIIHVYTCVHVKYKQYMHMYMCTCTLHIHMCMYMRVQCTLQQYVQCTCAHIYTCAYVLYMHILHAHIYSAPYNDLSNKVRVLSFSLSQYRSKDH